MQSASFFIINYIRIRQKSSFKKIHTILQKMNSLKTDATHECVSELRQSAFCQVEQAAESQNDD